MIPTQIARTNLPWWYWFFLSAMVISVSVQQVSRVNSRCMKSSRVLQSSNLSGAKELTLRIMCGLGFGSRWRKGAVRCEVARPSQEPRTHGDSRSNLTFTFEYILNFE